MLAVSLAVLGVLMVCVVQPGSFAEENQNPQSKPQKALTRPLRSIFVDNVWSGAPVGFHLLTRNGRQYVAYYDASRQMVIASRSLDSEEWTFQKLDEHVGWDSHNSATFAFDSEGYIHLSGNMHAVPLKYFRTKRPEDITSFERIPSMTGQDEERVTYPRFFYGPGGALCFAYRDGVSGNGREIVNIYDVKTHRWSRLLDVPLFDGEGKMNAYYVGPVRDRKGIYHLAWCWRDTGDCSTNHDVSYARSSDYRTFQKSDGALLRLPLTIGNSEIVDPIPVRSGLLNRIQLSFDSKDRVMITYMKFDEAGKTQLWTARREENGWKIYRTTDWKDRWEFQGGGTIPIMISYGGPMEWSKGTLCQLFTNKYISSLPRVRFLDEDTLQEVGESMLLYPSEFITPKKSYTEDWQVNVLGLSIPELLRNKHCWVLRWESAGPNRDRPRPEVPPPSRLEVVELALQ